MSEPHFMAVCLNIFFSECMNVNLPKEKSLKSLGLMVWQLNRINIFTKFYKYVLRYVVINENKQNENFTWSNLCLALLFWRAAATSLK